eukprot:CCRYP_009612-RA/>CCRYP_009612-RA protein AED:0.50 eAED:0.50 QI:0/-1/0/1/-1/1/1/0/141
MSPPSTAQDERGRVGGYRRRSGKTLGHGGQFNSAAASAAANANTSNGTNNNNASAAATTSTMASKSKVSGGFSLKGIKKGLQKIGEDLFVGDHKHNTTTTKEDVVPFDEYAWCDEHFTRGCACKFRGLEGIPAQDKPSQQS